MKPKELIFKNVDCDPCCGAWVTLAGEYNYREEVRLFGNTDQLKAEGVSPAVVSMPCLELFESQGKDYRNRVIPSRIPVVVVEAGVEQSWGRYLGEDGQFVGMKSFGASAPANDLFEHFGITTKNVVEAAKRIAKKLPS